MGELYRLDFPNGKSYVGMTAQGAHRRLVKHRYEATRSPKGYLYNAWREHGEPQLVILALVEEKEMLLTELRAIAIFGTVHPAGYNASPGGHIVTKAMTERISAALRGRVFTAAHRASLSSAKKGTKRPAVTRERMSLAQRKRRAMEGCIPQRWRYP